jgi:hypothetical protein
LGICGRWATAGSEKKRTAIKQEYVKDFASVKNL